MIYDGIEIFMMCIGNADCFLVVRHFPTGAVETVLIDGGNKASAQDIALRLHGLGVWHINHVVNTHPHDDHARGLVELISGKAFTYDKLWMHQAWKYIDWKGIREQLGRNSATWVLDGFNKSLSTQVALFNASQKRGILPVEPFDGAQIGPFTVLGPTPGFYKSCLLRFGDAVKVKQWNDYLQSESELDEFNRIIKEAVQDEGSLGDLTSPENESSVIMATSLGNQKILFCGDAGCDAFDDLNARKLAPLFKDVQWMHAPHHGSRRNLWPELVTYLNPTTVFVSCEGSRKHPSRKLVNAFKNGGKAKVYASYYPEDKGFTWIRQTYGTVPARNTIPAPALYDAA